MKLTGFCYKKILDNFGYGKKENWNIDTALRFYSFDIKTGQV